ncbi:YceI family protein [Lolliginicoccus suaedae]|uniref:YceI family protein n=1 Tax=Lolliginicoccus suaedae TaxID=2605429 RepID=UPI0011EFFCF4|nr:YceI family protein [Lolliginicoccus suaedae]
MRNNKLVIVLATAAVLIVGVIVVGPWAYGRFVVGEQPAELALPAQAQSSDSSAPDDLEGEWRVGPGSTAGYRVDEVLFGQNVTVVGRTESVTGSANVSGGILEGIEATVDMASVETDDERRDGQYRGRIMDTDTYPVSTFVQTEPVDLPEGSGPSTVPVTGELTVRGVTRTINADLDVQAEGDSVAVAGGIPVVFADYAIPEPSIAGITVEDSGVIEFLLVLSPRE